jgi:hypothetical protein
LPPVPLTGVSTRPVEVTARIGSASSKETPLLRRRGDGVQDRILSLTATEPQSGEPAWSGNTLIVGTVEKADEFTLVVNAGSESVTYRRR